MLAWSLVDHHCHAIYLMYFNVTVKEPISWVIRYDVDYSIASCWDENGIFAWYSLG